ncbi:MAG: RDD family protein [Candidatus Kapaibacterium sp.]
MKVQIQTTQNVDIEYEVANIAERIGAWAVDALILFGYIVVIYAGFLFIALNKNLLDRTSTIVALIIATIPFLFYELICETLMNGQSFGKKVFKLRVVKLDGSQPEIGGYFLRWLLRIPDIWMALGTVAVVTILFNGKGQRLGDLAAGTSVVKIKPTVTLSDTILAKVDDDYVPTYPQVMTLKDEDIAVIMEVLTSRDYRDDPVIMRALVTRIQDTLGVTSELTPRKFLRIVVKDYNHYASLM